MFAQKGRWLSTGNEEASSGRSVANRISGPIAWSRNRGTVIPHLPGLCSVDMAGNGVLGRRFLRKACIHIGQKNHVEFPKPPFVFAHANSNDYRLCFKARVHMV